MAQLLSAHQLSRSFGARTLFQGLSFTIAEGERIGLIGPNGSGKSTLLKLLAGLDEPEEGELRARKTLRLAYVAQTQSFDSAATVEEVVSAALDEPTLDLHERELRIVMALNRTGFDEPNTAAGTLSGGWQKRLAIAAALVGQPDLLLLDEPTNHLDFDGIDWLENLVSGGDFATLVVTHDRYFLERVASRIIELNPRFPEGMFTASGHYSDFLEKRGQFFAAMAKQQESLAVQVRREVQWLRQGPKARTSKSKYRIDAAYEKMDDLDEMRSRDQQNQAGINFSGSGRKTKRLLVADHLTKGYPGTKLFSELSFVLSPGTRLGLLGANGSGKSTLMKIIAGELEPDGGQVHTAPNLELVMFDQHREQLDPELSLRRTLAPRGDMVIYRDQQVHVMGWAKRFLFRPEQLEQPVKTLSGGEQARVLLARLMLRPMDLLLLDEPTNDLDIPTLEVLESGLSDFPGALVLVSHDRYLLDRVCNMTLGLNGDGNSEFYADYWQWWDELQKRRRSAARERTNVQAAQASPQKKSAKKRLSYLEKREWEGMEQRILEAETAVEQCRAAVSDPDVASNAGELARRYQALEDAEKAVETLYERWTELEQKQA